MLRKRKNRRYNETNDEEGDGLRKFDLQHQIKTDRFDQIRDKHLQEYPGDEISLRLIQRHGFEKPILVKKPDGLDLRVPPKSFLVRDVRNYVGHQRIIDVMDVRTQKNIEMSMKDWCKYYESKDRDRLLNVISLEFSHTKLDELVEAPLIVRLMDWVDLVWPKFLKQSQTESTNTITKMMYPKVQKYCLMSVKGSYTDFHIDFGGTSVWYHILKGKKIFWMVPPTELNLQIFEEWTLSGMQQDVFFGDTVEECFRVELAAGNTFFIPSGWIHAVYTLEDSLVFGGNFLHSFGIENQLKVSKIEDATKVPIKFRYPFYTEILWYVVQHYVYCLMKKDHLHQHEVMKAIESTKAALAEAEARNVEIEDESSDTEIEEIVSKPSKIKSVRRKKIPAKSKKNPKAKSRKTIASSTDDSSTEIDTDSEESEETIAKKQPVATCRMTKNSLLRLQYEIDEQSALDESTKPLAKTSESDKNQKRVKFQNPTQPGSPHPATLNLAEFALSNDSKPNGWTNSTTCTASSQFKAWSKPLPGPPEEKKIHITKYELNGLRVLQAHLSKLSKAKKNLPTLIRNSRALLDDCKKLIAEHENDDPELAITGIPITPELLSSPKKTDINELIDQFFKTTETTDKEESPSKKHSSVVCNQNKSRVEISHNRSRQSSLSIDYSNGSESTDSAATKTKEADTIESPIKSHKETKCLSPNKKMMNSSATLASTSTSTQTQRPKSPPTRPLSMNQYSSKTKIIQSNNNLLLPGSFADLIAATSTEKVFDVTGADATSSLFGIKDLGSTNKSSNAAHSISGNSLGVKDKVPKLSPSKSGLTTMTQPRSSFSSVDSLVSSPSPSGLPKESQKQHAQNPGNSSSPQKRYIVPNQFKPANKEKLIFASAPYISPVNSSDQSRHGNPYPWQTPARTPEQSNLCTTISQKPSHSTPSPVPPPQLKSTTDRPTSPPKSSSVTLQVTTPQTVEPRKNTSQINNATTMTKRESVIDHAPQQPHQPYQTGTNIQMGGPISSNSVTAEPPEQVTAKKPAKPRGPPKKSKEARQLLEAHSDVKPSIPTSVIKAGSSSSPSTHPEFTPQSAPPKQKPRRPKKQKSDATQITPVPQSVIRSPKPQAIYGLVTQPNKISINGAPKIGPQPYLITRPLLFNPMNTLSAAQYQQIQRAPVTSFTSPMIRSTINGAPSLSPGSFQQGARFVWAPRFSPPVTQTTGGQSQSVIRSAPTTALPVKTKTPASPASSSNKSKMATQPPSSTSHVDNAALLSLATTALSTASLTPTPTPTLSQLSHIMPSNQAIVVSSAAGNPQTLFANQQYFRPAFLPGMPITHFVGQPGGPRPSTTGQILYTRLPNQNQHRYLITQPGFMPHRFPTPHIVTSQPAASNIAYTAFRPPTDSAKELKTKKVKTS